MPAKATDPSKSMLYVLASSLASQLLQGTIRSPLIKTIGVVMDQPSASPQCSYTRGSQDKALLAMTIGQAFDNTVAQYPDGEALVVRHQQLRYTWRQLAEAADLHARALLALGLQAGDRLGIWAPNLSLIHI